MLRRRGSCSHGAGQTQAAQRCQPQSGSAGTAPLQGPLGQQLLGNGLGRASVEQPQADQMHVGLLGDLEIKTMRRMRSLAARMFIMHAATVAATSANWSRERRSVASMQRISGNAVEMTETCGGLWGSNRLRSQQHSPGPPDAWRHNCQEAGESNIAGSPQRLQPTHRHRNKEPESCLGMDC